MKFSFKFKWPKFKSKAQKWNEKLMKDYEEGKFLEVEAPNNQNNNNQNNQNNNQNKNHGNNQNNNTNNYNKKKKKWRG